MRFVFFGSPHFAARILEHLRVAKMMPCVLVTNPDRPTGRHRTLTPPEAKVWRDTQAPHLPLAQPEKARDIEPLLRDLRPDFGVVAAYAKILPPAILNIFPKGIVGVHPSLLPLYRGASPIQTALLEGATTSGVTLYQMDDQVDHGPIIAQKSLSEPFSEMTYRDAEKALADLGAAMLVESLPGYGEGAIPPQPQDESRATFTKKLTSNDGRIDPDLIRIAENGDSPNDARALFLRIKAFTPEPGAWTEIKGRRVKILAAALRGPTLHITLIQPDGKKPYSPIGKLSESF